jgi:hypothetical protein
MSSDKERDPALSPAEIEAVRTSAAIIFAIQQHDAASLRLLWEGTPNENRFLLTIALAHTAAQYIEQALGSDGPAQLLRATNKDSH